MIVSDSFSSASPGDIPLYSFRNSNYPALERFQLSESRGLASLGLRCSTKLSTATEFLGFGCSCKTLRRWPFCWTKCYSEMLQGSRVETEPKCYNLFDRILVCYKVPTFGHEVCWTECYSLLDIRNDETGSGTLCLTSSEHDEQ
ncbi:hypothetical protein L596_002313 [Steinernema carpocapsae]|uniref:Uncharacterized protein n=1 Tax=Steinernema carpocapsae TaxID=34508 RepID=A0A4U8UP85_STECR|nr:hypothetical protein L596_002313 [Steinernema carpocapsae]